MRTTFFLTLLILCLSSTCCYGRTWPEIAPVAGKVSFTDTTNATLQVNITDIHHKPLYILTCKSGDVPFENDFTFSGLFHCRLVSLYSNNGDLPSLLFEDPNPTAGWEGRGRFLLSNVVGRCAATPDFGAQRTFLLRRMRILLGIHDIKLVGDIHHFDIKSYTFTYNIMPDDSAASSLVRKPKTKEPWWFNGESDQCMKDAFKINARDM